jgi:hypothetical protein
MQPASSPVPIERFAMSISFMAAVFWLPLAIPLIIGVPRSIMPWQVVGMALLAMPFGGAALLVMPFGMAELLGLLLVGILLGGVEGAFCAQVGAESIISATTVARPVRATEVFCWMEARHLPSQRQNGVLDKRYADIHVPNLAPLKDEMTVRIVPCPRSARLSRRSWWRVRAGKIFGPRLLRRLIGACRADRMARPGCPAVPDFYTS